MTEKLFPHFNPEVHKIEGKIAMVRTSHHCKYNINDHIIWIPKYRKQVLTGKVVEVLRAIIDGQCQDMNKVLEINPTSAKAYIYRADFKFSKNDFKGAETDYTKAIEIESNNELAYAYRGIVKITIYKDSAGALKDFDKSIQIKPNEVAHTFRAQIHMGEKDYDNAIKDLDNAIKINPIYVNARMFRGGIRFGILQKFEGALEDYNKAIELELNNAIYYTFRGDVKAELGDEKGSKADYAKAEALDPNVWSLRQK